MPVESGTTAARWPWRITQSRLDCRSIASTSPSGFPPASGAGGRRQDQPEGGGLGGRPGQVCGAFLPVLGVVTLRQDLAEPVACEHRRRHVPQRLIGP